MTGQEGRRWPWLRSPAWDGFWLLAGLWALAAAVLLEGTAAFGRLALALTLAFWIAHRLASAYLALCHGAYRRMVASHPAKFLGVPAAVLAGVTGVLLAPESLLPLPVGHRVLALAAVDLCWEGWHFAIQHYGVVSVYRLRAGQGAAAPAKAAEKAFCLAAGGGLVFAAAAYHLAPRHLFPLWTPWAASALAAAGLAGMLARELREARPSGPKLLYLASVALPGAAAFHFDSLAPTLVVVPVQHWLAALGISLHMAAAPPGAEPAPSLWYRAWGWVNGRPWRVLPVLGAASAALAPVMKLAQAHKAGLAGALARLPEAPAAAAVRPLWDLPVFSGLAWILDHSLAARLLLAVGFSTAFAHYLMDRWLFKLSDPEARRVALPLLLGEAPSPTENPLR